MTSRTAGSSSPRQQDPNCNRQVLSELTDMSVVALVPNAVESINVAYGSLVSASLLGLLRHPAEAERDWRTWITPSVTLQKYTARVTPTSTTLTSCANASTAASVGNGSSNGKYPRLHHEL